MNGLLLGKITVRLLLFALALGLTNLALPGRLEAAESVTEQVSAAASDTQKALDNAQQTARTRAEEIWRRIDEKRLKNRTPDQLVAWVIMGLLAAGLIRLFSKTKGTATLLFGLAGAFVGGLAANALQVNLGLGPVLISYEELFASLAGALVLVIAARYVLARRTPKKEP